MSLVEIITKQLNSYPKLKKQARVSYFESVPLRQVHIDTMFWHISMDKNAPKIPILCVVDVATRYTRYFVQTTKSENIKGFLGEFIIDVKKRWKKTSSDMILITDGAPEFKKLSGTNQGVNVQATLSKGINKAVLAEVSIRKARAILRTVETSININNLKEGTHEKIDHGNIKSIFKIIEERINLKAKLREPKPPLPWSPPEFEINTPVFALNFYKFYPHALGDQMTKQSYKLNYYYEPFRIFNYRLINGIYKYTLASLVDGKELKFGFYADQLQEIDKRVVSEYINVFRKNAPE